MAKVSLVKCGSYEQEELFAAIEKALKPFGGINHFVKKGQTVLLKPNMLTLGKKEKCISTHPEIVRAVLKLVRKAGGKPMVGDSPGFFSARRIARSNGILRVCEEEKIDIVEFKNHRTILCKGLLTNRFPIAKAVLEADVVINLCKAKTHGVTLFSGAVKNLFGCISGLHKARYHLVYPSQEDFSKMLADLACFINPKLSIMDGVYGMEGKGGPNMGRVKKLGFIGASDNAAALDLAVCSALGYKDEEVRTNAYAKKAFRLRTLDYPLRRPVELGVQGFKRIKHFRAPSYGLPAGAARWLNSFFSAKPVVNKKCNSCMACVKVCPVKTIRINERAEIDHSGCISCYCCFEVCPCQAISLKKNALLKLAEFIK